LKFENKNLEKLSFVNDEISAREFNFSVFVILMSIFFRNFFRGHGFKIHFNSDLFFELTLLLLPISLMLVKYSSDREVANTFRFKSGIVFFIIINVLLFALARFLFYISTFAIPFFDAIFSILGLFFMIASILNILNSLLIISLKIQGK
jgi:uncharacterized membrane protein